MPGIYRLKGVIKHYDWGGVSFIPSLLQEDNTSREPFAEYWMGIHPLGTATIEINGKPQLMTASVKKLSYLLKVLDVEKMLSIQVHPSKNDAEKGFAKENNEGIPINSPQRNYKDDNHKPELMVALSDFWLLHGFKPKTDLEEIVSATPELNSLLPVFQSSGYAGLYKFIMEMEQATVNSLLQPLLERILPLYTNNKTDKFKEDFWAARAAQTFSADGNIDKGIFSIYLFNLVFLKKGEGIFQDAGVPHAYLEGQNVEIMANSDNVLRGGLTNKHIDVSELLKHVKCEATLPKILSGKESSLEEKVYEVPVTDFQLSVIHPADNGSFIFFSETPELLLLTEGRAEISCDDVKLDIKPGMPALFILPGSKVQVKANDHALLFRASSPIHKG